MRLDRHQITKVVHATQAIAGVQASVWLFGSRLNDLVKGGDVDLLIESSPPLSLMKRARLKMDLENSLSLPVDIAAASRDDQSPFILIARAQAICLNSLIFDADKV